MFDNFSPGAAMISAAVLVQLLAVLPLMLKDERRANLASNAILILGLTGGLSAVIAAGLNGAEACGETGMPGGWINTDFLSLFFLFLIQLVAVPTTIFNISYLRHYTSNKRPVKSFILFYIILVVSTQLLVIANHAILFLVCWEVMSMSAYMGIVFEHEKEEVQKGSFYYFAASHVIVFILYLFFFVLHYQSGSWFFSEFRLSSSLLSGGALLFVTAFIGFGIKAGFLPFHFWLPQAHPIAPTVLSAFLSGIIIKTGIYGILRAYQFLRPVPEWCGWVVLSVSIISAVLGVWYALAQHDIKRLLAYHSVENIGIIGIGIGLGMIGAAKDMPAVEILGFGGALLHTMNHAIFKSLLFIGSGIVYQNTGTRNIELMGGIVHRAKYLAILFLIGSVAICGLPPLNGFISEFIIYSGFFKTAAASGRYYPIMMLMFVVGLAFVGGLAVACFTKVNAIMFLGSARKESASFHVSGFDYSALGILAALCVIIGILPGPVVGVINTVVCSCLAPGSQSDALIRIDWFYLTVIFTSAAAGLFLLYFLKLRHERRFGRRVSDAWGCGYDGLSARMQYTASSFADELNTIPKSLLVYEKKVEISETPFPLKSEFTSHSIDFIDRKIILPAVGLLRSITDKLGFFSQSDLRYYIAFILISLTFYSLVALLWF